MWHLKMETQGHETVDLGQAYETPEKAYAAVIAWCDRAEAYEEESQGAE